MTTAGAGMGTMTTTAALKAVGMQGHLTTVIAIPTAVTVTLPVPLGTGEKMHGITIAVVINIITGSKRERRTYEQAHV